MSAANQVIAAGSTRADRILLSISRFSWHVVLPGIGALFCCRFLIPTSSAAKGTWAGPLAAAGESFDAAFGIGLFVVFALLARYWGGWLEGGPRMPAETRGVVGVVALAAVAAVVALGLRSAGGAYRVLSASMLPTLSPDDFVLGSKVAYRLPWTAAPRRLPVRGDLIVFRNPMGGEGPGLVVKRVFGLPGDRIQMNGMQPIINGWKVPHCDVGGYIYPLSSGGGVAARLHVEFLDGRAHLALYAPASQPFTATYEVKSGEVFVLGDNRVNSLDSRSWNNGNGAGLPVERIEARVDALLAGVRRDEQLGFGHSLQPFELNVRLDGLDTLAMRDGIQRCLRNAPAQNAPPRADAR